MRTLGSSVTPFFYIGWMVPKGYLNKLQVFLLTEEI